MKISKLILALAGFVALAPASAASDQTLDDWGMINAHLKCAAFAKISKHAAFKRFERRGVERLRTFFRSFQGSIFDAFPFEKSDLRLLEIDSSIDFKTGLAFSVLHRQALETIAIQTDQTVTLHFSSAEQISAAQKLYQDAKCGDLLL